MNVVLQLRNSGSGTRLNGSRAARDGGGSDPTTPYRVSFGKLNAPRGDEIEGYATGRPIARSSFINDPGAKILCGRQRIPTAAEKEPRQPRKEEHLWWMTVGTQDAAHDASDNRLVIRRRFQ